MVFIVNKIIISFSDKKANTLPYLLTKIFNYAIIPVGKLVPYGGNDLIFFDNILRAVGGVFDFGQTFYDIVLFIISIFFMHHAAYTLIGVFFTRKFAPAKNFHKYAILIPARNESGVIGNLIDSIHYQDYPKDFLTVFVVADNCTDNTAEIARQKGAICYERNNQNERTKGFALRYLFQQIEKDYGIDSFEGYFIFDSDNLLNKDYISRMNDAFDSGLKIITSYRNTKNFDENWIASTYAIHWLRSIRLNHRARSVLRLATNIQGTGFLFANELVKDGWKYTSLTEDRAFTADAVAHGYQISYNDAAMFYDEQPTSIKVALRQRLRWSKGHLLAFLETGWSLFKNIFVGNCYRDKSVKRDWNMARVIEGIRCRWASFDTLAQLVPKNVITLFAWIISAVIIQSCYGYANGVNAETLNTAILNLPFSPILLFKKVNISPGFTALFAMMGITFLCNIIRRITVHIGNSFYAVYVLVAERKKIIKMPLRKKILYTFTWFVFDAIGRWTMYAALFMKVEWKPIPHTSTLTINDIDTEIEHNIDRNIVNTDDLKHK